jgi:hypothetical protein
MARKRQHGYEPTPTEIRSACEKIRRGWSGEDKAKRKMNLPPTQHWMPATISGFTNEYGEFCLLTRQEEEWWTDARGYTV